MLSIIPAPKTESCKVAKPDKRPDPIRHFEETSQRMDTQQRQLQASISLPGYKANSETFTLSEMIPTYSLQAWNTSQLECIEQIFKILHGILIHPVADTVSYDPIEISSSAQLKKIAYAHHNILLRCLHSLAYGETFAQ